MSDNEGKSISLVNLGSLTKPVDTATKGVVDGAGAFLSRVCLPAAEEFGLYLRDRISNWRALNLAKVLKKTQAKLKSDYKETPPKFILQFIEGASQEDGEELQDIWANLLASALDPEYKEGIRTAYIDIIQQLEVVNVRVLSAIHSIFAERVRRSEQNRASLIPYKPRIDKGEIMEEVGLSDETQYKTAVDNLIRLRCIETYAETKMIKTETPGGYHFYETATLDKGYEAVSMTALGEGFIKACTRQTRESIKTQ